jgi:hypothetical protein
MMGSLWEHEDRTEQIPAYPVTGEFQALLGPDDPFPVQHAASPRSIFVPVFWGVLCALVVFTLLAGTAGLLLLDQAVKP